MCHRGVLWSLSLLALCVILMVTCFAWDECCPIIIKSWSRLKLDLFAKTCNFSKSFEISSTWEHKNTKLMRHYVPNGNHIQEAYLHIDYNSLGVSIWDAGDINDASDPRVETVQGWLIQCQTGPAAAWSHGEWALTPYGNKCIICLKKKIINLECLEQTRMNGEGWESHMQVTWEPQSSEA